MATIPIIDRARILMDLTKDGEVAALADYANVEQATAALALKYAQAFWDAPGFIHPVLVDENEDPRDPTNNELATNYVNRLKQYHKDILAAKRVTDAANTARVAEAATVAAEGTTDLGDTES